MSYTTRAMTLGLCTVLLAWSAPALGQLRGSIGGGFGGRGGIGGYGGSGGYGGRGSIGGSGVRGGLGFGSNPIANPAPSLTPHEVFNPRGSLSPGQVFDPSPSLFRPRSGGSSPQLGSARSPGQSRLPHERLESAYGAPALGAMANVNPGNSIQAAAASLARELRQAAPNKGWQRYLSLDTLQNLGDQPTSAAEKEKLHTVLSNFETVETNDEFAVIRRLPSFQTAATTLRDYLRPVEERRIEELTSSFALLERSLRKYGNGDAWAEYLQLPVRVSSGQAVDGDARQIRELEELLARFHKLRDDPTYSKVSELPAFLSAHSALAAYLSRNPKSPPNAAPDV